MLTILWGDPMQRTFIYISIKFNEDDSSRKHGDFPIFDYQRVDFKLRIAHLDTVFGMMSNFSDMDKWRFLSSCSKPYPNSQTCMKYHDISWKFMPREDPPSYAKWSITCKSAVFSWLACVKCSKRLWFVHENDCIRSCFHQVCSSMDSHFTHDTSPSTSLPSL